MRWDSPFVLATSGALAIHLLLAIISDALVVTHPPVVYKPPPKLELVDIVPPPIVKPPPEPEPEVKQPDEAPRPVERRVTPKTVRQPTPPPETKLPPPPPNTQPQDDSGGAPVATMQDIAPSATARVAVAQGPASTGKVGRGGTGGGTGAGTGTGSSSAPPTPVSVATIKARAMPRGDFSYFDASKEYPAEAKTLGIEGVIRVRLVVDDKGKVKSTLLLNRLGHGLDELALKRAAAIEFEPARDTNDQPVSSVVVWTFNMTLPK